MLLSNYRAGTLLGKSSGRGPRWGGYHYAEKSLPLASLQQEGKQWTDDDDDHASKMSEFAHFTKQLRTMLI